MPGSARCDITELSTVIRDNLFWFVDIRIITARFSGRAYGDPPLASLDRLFLTRSIGGPMIGVLVTFAQTDKFDRSTLAKIADELREPFEGMAGLRFKSFMLDEDGLRARNFYVWDDVEKARAFFTEEIVDKVTGIYGVPPEIEYLDIVGFVDNSGT
jgi:hypothetical protein